MHFHPDWNRALSTTPSTAMRRPATDRPCGDSRRDLSATRVALLRERVRSGFYASPAVMDMLAERLAASGDL